MQALTLLLLRQRLICLLDFGVSRHGAKAGPLPRAG